MTRELEQLPQAYGIRFFEEKVTEPHKRPQIVGPAHMCNGQTIYVGARAALTPSDNGLLAGAPVCQRDIDARATMVILGSDLGLLIRSADSLAAKYVKRQPA
jgi:hypothetical protein